MTFKHCDGASNSVIKVLANHSEEADFPFFFLSSSFKKIWKSFNPFRKNYLQIEKYSPPKTIITNIRDIVQLGAQENLKEMLMVNFFIAILSLFYDLKYQNSTKNLFSKQIWA